MEIRTTWPITPVLVSVPFKLLYTVIRRFMPVFSKGTVSPIKLCSLILFIFCFENFLT